MPKTTKRVVVDAVSLTLTEQESFMLTELQYELRKTRSEILRILIKREYELMMSADHEESI